MNMETELFKGRKILYDTLIPYGFKKTENGYILIKPIMENSFQVILEISQDGEVKGRVYDLEFQEEYTNYRIATQTGEFVNKVREAFRSVLLDVKKNCTETSYFSFEQANRLTQLIWKHYQDSPEFAWAKFPSYGIFRNPQNKKWYALIMTLPKEKLDVGKEEVAVLNVKLPEEKVISLLQRKGFYKAYHMNKEKWITILLDDTLTDEEIMEYIAISHQFTEVKRK